MRAQFVCILLTDLSIAIILGQEIGVLPIHDLYIRFHGGWAPQIENDPRGYINFVSEWTGIEFDEQLGNPTEHPARWMAVALAMAMFEGGLNDATPLIVPMFQGWEMCREVS